MTAILRGWQYFFTLTREDLSKAREMWEKAIEPDPKYAEACVGVGLTYYLEGIMFQSSGKLSIRLTKWLKRRSP